ncbi:RNA polymerase sigma factor [Actibacterium sp. 188UL27-1]|uniref:RNA polymerase sigma factor n=1 Tax=Actibacterium sp. 188UL27-1 TaxID=2786961 RepID=UPI00195A8E6D|nr:RNA polymerase sigma factor [Actibacterium sp. 188UL27-1]MBM7069299.1 RNA polymerase sigma factor [Actibacterium sp. 188UL27-1]
MDPKRRALEAFLVVSSKMGDRQAMSQLVDLRGPSLLAHAARLLGNADDAEDAVQHAWIDIFRGLRRLQDVRAFPAWAHRIVTRRCAKLIRGEIRDRAIRDQLMAEPEPPPTGAAEVCDDARHIRRAIDCLPPNHRATLALFYLEEMGVADVAVALEIPVGTVKSRLSAARAKLKEILKGDHHD